MDLSLTDDQLFMRDEANRFLAERATSQAVRAAIAAGGHDASLWKTISRELGWCGTAIPDEHGGLGLGATELVLLAEETGRRLTPVPFWSTACLAAPVLLSLPKSEARNALLTRIAAGDATATVALSEPGARNPLSQRHVTAEKRNNGWRLSGECPAVANLASADIVLMPADCGGGIGVFAVEVARATVTALDVLDPTMPMAALSLDNVTVDAAARLDDGGVDGVGFAEPLLWARIGLAAEQVGAAQGCLDLTLDYIGERVQFGRTIASFQAIKHRCAELFVHVAEARSLLYGAAASLDADAGEAGLEIDAAAVLATEVLWCAAEEAIQLHGGVGNTWEYDPHFYLRRAQATAQMFGGSESSLSALANEVLGAAA
jgi:acyl-CoA dehydrogenase